MIRLELLKLARVIEELRIQNAYRSQYEQYLAHKARAEVTHCPEIEKLDHNKIIKVAEDLNKFVSFG